MIAKTSFSFSKYVNNFVVILFCLFSFCRCGTTIKSHPYVDFNHPLKQDSGVAVAKSFQSDNSAEICALLAMPGDFVLSHMSGSGLGKAAYQPFLFPIMFLELLDLNDPFTKYFHAEMIIRVDQNMKMRTRGFYPFSKRYIPNMFHDNYTIFRVPESPQKQEAALLKLEEKDYPGFGVCSDYIAWAFDGRIYSWWNFIPYVQDILVRVYPPEALQTSDNLANSPQTVKICEVRKGKFVYPDRISTALLMEHLKRNLDSSNAQIRDHAAHVRKMLLLFSYINAADAVLIPEIILTKSAD